MRENAVKRTIASGGVSLGTMAFEFNTTGLARLAAGAGAEFVVFDQEHTGWSVETIRMLVATSGATDMVPMVRVPTTQYHLIARVLDVGARGIMVPMVESVEQARTDRPVREVPAGRPARCRVRRRPRRLQRRRRRREDPLGERRDPADRPDRDRGRRRVRRGARGRRRDRRALDRPLRPDQLDGHPRPVRPPALPGGRQARRRGLPGARQGGRDHGRHRRRSDGGAGARASGSSPTRATSGCISSRCARGSRRSAPTSARPDRDAARRPGPDVSPSRTTGLRSTPMPGMSTSTTSPCFMFSGAPSVPIQITSPG